MAGNGLKLGLICDKWLGVISIGGLSQTVCMTGKWKYGIGCTSNLAIHVQGRWSNSDGVVCLNVLFI